MDTRFLRVLDLIQSFRNRSTSAAQPFRVVIARRSGRNGRGLGNSSRVPGMRNARSDCAMATVTVTFATKVVAIDATVPDGFAGVITAQACATADMGATQACATADVVAAQACTTTDMGATQACTTADMGATQACTKADMVATQACATAIATDAAGMAGTAVATMTSAVTAAIATTVTTAATTSIATILRVGGAHDGQFSGQ
ncbi:hypothetical protein EMIT0194MI4_10524 [Pseudomonas sp. IT-194MI4]